MVLSSRLTAVAILLLVAAAILPSTTAAAKLKGIKGASSGARSERHLKKIKADGKLPGKKVKGPQGRSCTSTAKKNEVRFECRTRSGDLSGGPGAPAPKAQGPVGAEEKAAKDPKEPKEPKGQEDTARSGFIGEEPEEDDDPAALARGINLTPSEEIRDEIKYTVKTSKKGIRVAIEYKQEVESLTSENKTETEFELNFENIVEYVKGSSTQRWGWNNGVSTEAYDWDTDEIIQSIQLENWDAIPGITSDAEGVVSHFTASAALTSPVMAVGPTGRTYFNFTVSEADVNEQITANSMKIDVRIVDFPWARSDSYLALMSTVESKKKVKLEYDDEALVSGGKSKLTQDVYVTFDEGLDDLGIEAFGAYTWEHGAEAEGPNQDVPPDRAVTVPTATARNANGAVVEDVSVLPTEPEENNNSNETRFNDDVSEQPPPPPPSSGIVEDVSAHPGHDEAPVLDADQNVRVIATSPQELATDNRQEIAYSFVGGAVHMATEIYWDPQTGIGYGEAPVTSAASKLASMGALLGAVLMYLVL